MVRELLLRGMLVGLVAGSLVFGVGLLFGEPSVDRAIGFETAASEARAKADAARGIHVDAEPELVSRETQAGLGLFTGVTVYAIAFGGLFALVFAAVDGRMAALGPRATAALLAALGFIAIYLVPNLKYPASPPSVGAPDTIGQRTALYFAMLGLSVAAMVVAMIIRRRVVSRHGEWNAALAAGGLYSIAIGLVAWMLPGINEVPAEFPATVLWNFRVASFGMQGLLWLTLGLGFGLLAERLLPATRGSARREPVYS